MSASGRIVYQLKITLEGTTPPVWRRVLVYGHSTFLAELHFIIQDCMGWEDYHLHVFRHKDKEYGDNDPEFEPPENQLDEEKYIIRDLLEKEGDSLKYVYDFGDNWHHSVQLEKTMPSYREKKLPYCIDGARHCPPEDIGSTIGYQQLVQFCEGTLGKAGLKHDHYQELVGFYTAVVRETGFSPDAFDLTAVNAKMKDLR